MGSISYPSGSISQPPGSISNGAGSISSPSTGTISTETGASFVFTDASIPFDQRITFARSTVANRFNSAGTLTSTAIDVARANANQDYNPSTLAARGFLIEAGATNLLTRSEEFDNAAWTKTDIAVTANNATAPDGTTTADLLTEGSAGTALLTRASSATVSAGATVTQTVFIKRSAVVQWYRFRVTNSAGANGGQAWFDILNGVVGTIANVGSGTNTSAAMQALPNGWYRLTVTTTLAGGDTTALYQALAASADGNPSRLSNAAYWVWGAQLEANAFATSYIATGASATARGADNAVISNLASIGFSATQGFVYCEFMMEGLGSTAFPSLLSFNDGTASNRITIRVLDGLTDTCSLLATAGGVQQASITDGAIVTANTLVKLAASWASGSWLLAANGVAATSANGASMPVVTQLQIGQQLGGNYLNGWLPKIQYGPQHLSQAQLNALTA